MLTNTHEFTDLAAATRAAAIRSGQRPSDAEQRTLNAETRRIARHVTCQACRDVADFSADDFELLMREAV